MDSEKLNNKNPAFSENVQIKVEPGTSSLPVPLKNIKTEPGVAPTTTRLTSFRLPRDLTLGGSIKTEKPKKVYVPNLNTQRNRKKEETVVVKNDPEKSSKQRGRGRGRGLSDRGRGRGNSNLIQTSGVFSQGATDPQTIRRSRGEGGYSSDRKPMLNKPKLDLNRVIDKDEEERKLKALLRDDFIDDGTDDAVMDMDNAPISLPLIKKTDCFKIEAKTEASTLDNEEIDRKPIILENGTIMETKKEIKTDKLVKSESIETNLWNDISQITESKPHSYMLMQFPDALPGLEASSDNNIPKSKYGNEKTQTTEDQNSPKKNFTLCSLKAGMIGKLQILKSGNARLCIGKSSLIVNVGSNQSYRQDLIAAKLNTSELDGELINLGTVTNTLICSPEWDSMFLNSSNAIEDLSSL